MRNLNGTFAAKWGLYHRMVRIEETAMFGLAIVFLLVAIGSGLLGFAGIAGIATEMAKIVFFVALILFVLSFIVGLFRGRRF